MAYHPNGNGAQPPFANARNFFPVQQQGGNGGNGQQDGNGGRWGQLQGNGGGLGQHYGNGGYGQQLGNGVYGQHHRNDFDRQQHGNLGTGQQNGGYGFLAQQPQPNGMNGINHPNGIAPNATQQQAEAYCFQTQVQAPNGRIGTNRKASNPNAPPFVPRSEAPKASAQPSVPRAAQRPPIHVEVIHGDPDIVHQPGFYSAAIGQPLFGNEEEENASDNSEESQRRAEEEQQVWTPESAARVRAERHQRRQANGQNSQHHRGRQQQALRPTQMPAGVPIELQNGVGRLRTGKAVYTIIDIIEHGGDFMRMSNGIYVVGHPNGSQRVAKFLKPTIEPQMERARAERNVLLKLKELSSPHINFIYEAYWPNGDVNCILILEYCEGGSIEKRIRIQQQKEVKFTEEFMWHFISHMCAALAACHNGVRNPLKKELQAKTWNCIAHLDIKPANVFISFKRGKGMEDDEFPTIVLGDFGCAVTADDILQGKFNKRVQPFGTEGWYAPETKATTGKHAGRYGKSTDIWQLGALIVCMCRLTVVPDPNHLYSAQPCGLGYSTQLQTVAKWCLNVDLEKRPSAVDIVEKMKAWKKIVVEGEESGENSGRA